ncbi:MAG TPA: NAD(P)-binding domain-containing protein [Haliscomenobacter sp.]|uniref:flavin-containing monooxygenase n=1 Tax=Haliscomenobacter sp. TaxID=2717303 RepID=UPI002C9FE00D|nr:NAD(P)-binding domain-containing protein [Haliscomenobacter sp.]HOY17652.1 NAD(P)-binding domain-containing protein [Haliscomenobacter sp.]HPH17284.1 NAD(P)-binding domain-containing protein [Haliscomenobacter sp.]
MKRICVIGAGCSGITTIKNLLQAGLYNLVCYEQNNQIGGNWVYAPHESHSSVCETTHIISSKKMSEFVDFPMPDDYPDYPSHAQLLRYFQAYVKHFDLSPYIQFNTKVVQAEKIADERWLVTLGNGQQELFDYLLVANGHHNVPRHPEHLPGNFSGRYLHAHQYKNAAPFQGERVLVIGAGNSGCDCAVEISRVAEFVTISTRGPQYIVPKFFMGKPTDTFNGQMLWIPKPIAAFLRQLSLRIQVGKYSDYGLPDPNFPVLKAHPTVNSELLYKIRHGKVHPRPAVASVEGKRVRFTNGTEEEYDTIVAATGYKISTPFFATDFINYEEADRVPLYLRMFHADHPTLAFIGLFQPQGAIWPGSDLQAKLVANYIAGLWKMPANVAELAEQDAAHIDREFLKAKRHTIEVHVHEFERALKRQILKIS